MNQKHKETWVSTLMLTGIIIFLLGVVNVITGLVAYMIEPSILVSVSGGVSILLGIVMIVVAKVLTPKEVG